MHWFRHLSFLFDNPPRRRTILGIAATGTSGSIGRHLQGVDPLNFRLPNKEINMQNELVRVNCTTLIHLAAITNPELVAKDVARSDSINVDSSVSLIRAFIKVGGKRFIFASTSHVYGPQMIGHFSSESDNPNPISLYSQQKLRAERAITEIAEQNEIDLIIVRIFSVFGPSMAQYYLAGTVLNQLGKRVSYPTISNSEDVRDFSQPSWVAKKLKEFCGLEKSGTLVCNIASGTPTSIREKVLQENPNWPSASFDGRQSNLPWLVGSNLRLKELLPNMRQ
jgi:nucleoside-diphosphate-sugar epimerase